jgi:trehalose 6-phosphate phosphatase
MIETLPTIARDWALFLDVDGTLIDYVPRPDTAIVPSSLLRTLKALSAVVDGGLALVSGRSIAALDELFAPLHLPVAGQHGAEARRADRTETLAPASPVLASILARVNALAEHWPTIMVENKGLTATIHYADIGERTALVMTLSDAIAQCGGAFRLLPSRSAFNVVPQSVDKGRAVTWFMTAAPFAGRVPVFIGDDLTDEEGFAAVASRGGYAIKVGPETRTIASWRIAGPRALHQWFDRSLTTLEPAR